MTLKLESTTNELWKGWNLAWYHHFTHIACAKKLRGLRQKLDALRVQTGCHSILAPIWHSYAMQKWAQDGGSKVHGSDLHVITIMWISSSPNLDMFWITFWISQFEPNMNFYWFFILECSNICKSYIFMILAFFWSRLVVYTFPNSLYFKRYELLKLLHFSGIFRKRNILNNSKRPLVPVWSTNRD